LNNVPRVKMDCDCVVAGSVAATRFTLNLLRASQAKSRVISPLTSLPRLNLSHPYVCHTNPPMSLTTHSSLAVDTRQALELQDPLNFP
jgi:hypothetical protein